jgi:hypothetical protein
MNTKEIREVKFGSYRLVVRSANVEVGFIRTMMRNKTIEEDKARGELQVDDLPELSRRVMHTQIYPSLMAAVIEHEGFDHWPLTFEEFYDLPEGIEPLWEAAVYELNPHWLPGQKEVTEAEKKDLNDNGPKQSTGPKRERHKSPTKVIPPNSTSMTREMPS